MVRDMRSRLALPWLCVNRKENYDEYQKGFSQGYGMDGRRSFCGGVCQRPDDSIGRIEVNAYGGISLRADP